MTDDERLAEFLGWTRCPGEHLLIGTKTCAGWLTASGSHEAYVPDFDDTPYGWMALGELTAAIEAKGWAWTVGGYSGCSAWSIVHDEYIEADNLPEAVRNAVLAALESE